MSRAARPDTLNDPHPAHFNTDWVHMIPSGVFAEQGKNGIGIADSISASHINGAVCARYRQSYIDLTAMGLTDDQIKEVWSIAHDFQCGEEEIARLMLSVRDSKGGPVSLPLSFGRTRMARHQEDAVNEIMADFSKKFSTGNDPIIPRPSKKKETFSQRYDRQVREARQQKKK